MRKLAIFLQFVLMVQIAVSQEVCETKETIENDNDISSITKCSVTGKLNDNGTNSKSKVTVVSSRSRQKRRSNETKQRFNNHVSKQAKINDSIQQLKLNHVHENITAINTALEEKLLNEQVSFNDVEYIPQFRNCSEDLDVFECFNYEMQKHLIDNIIYPEKALKKRIEGDVWVSFIITKSGEIKNIIATGPENSEMLKKEAIRVISILPSFIPGKQNNQNVNVTYTFPISFNLDNVFE
ncbi:TonB family C-terminal domain-containing protein [Tenacibaculum sp. MAR_2009_124]|uniref:energy transducer TonB n=1 Tax=Tenacibaculum sp. MAR_2009_124 TaxID=1250059 RepID=UPI00089BBE2C|nr:energy transducer TonB [Tenacibaculum sp. MAR_2009_124]SEC33140.1 TonB family C-terminal domain-containing protein [Tenacibaculum sp. MAR_2009_124]